MVECHMRDSNLHQRPESDGRKMPLMDDPRNRFTLQAEKDFRPSVRPIYRNSDQDMRVEHVGSSLLLDIDGSRCIVTAAHIMDQGVAGPLYIAGRPGTQLVPILDGNVMTTLMPAARRKSDPNSYRAPGGIFRTCATLSSFSQSRLRTGAEY